MTDVTMTKAKQIYDKLAINVVWQTINIITMACQNDFKSKMNLQYNKQEMSYGE